MPVSNPGANESPQPSTLKAQHPQACVRTLCKGKFDHGSDVPVRVREGQRSQAIEVVPRFKIQGSGVQGHRVEGHSVAGIPRPRRVRFLFSTPWCEESTGLAAQGQEKCPGSVRSRRSPTQAYSFKLQLFSENHRASFMYAFRCVQRAGIKSFTPPRHRVPLVAHMPPPFGKIYTNPRGYLVHQPPKQARQGVYTLSSVDLRMFPQFGR